MTREGAPPAGLLGWRRRSTSSIEGDICWREIAQLSLGRRTFQALPAPPTPLGIPTVSGHPL